MNWTQTATFDNSHATHGKTLWDAGTVNFVWIQHLPLHSATTSGNEPNGSMALLLANGSMSSNFRGEDKIVVRTVNDDSRLDTSVYLN